MNDYSAVARELILRNIHIDASGLDDFVQELSDAIRDADKQADAKARKECHEVFGHECDKLQEMIKQVDKQARVELAKPLKGIPVYVHPTEAIYVNSEAKAQAIRDSVKDA